MAVTELSIGQKRYKEIPNKKDSVHLCYLITILSVYIYCAVYECYTKNKNGINIGPHRS